MDGMHDSATAGGGRPFVGRDSELAELRQILERAITYETPQTVTLVGNQGVGKSRLIEHWLEEVVAQRPEVRIYRATAHPGGPAYCLFSNLLESRFCLAEAENKNESFREQVEEVLLDRRLAEVLHFLGGFVEVTVRENPFLSAIEDVPAQHDQISRTVLRRFWELDGQRSPVLLVLEDLQLADADSLSLYKELAERLQGSPLVLIGSCRPELLVQKLDLSKIEGDHCLLEIPLLTPDKSEALLRELLHKAADLPQPLVEMAVEMTAGNPFFLEQLVKVMIDRGIVEQAGELWTVNSERLEEVELPLTVEEAVRARIAVLSPTERDVLEKASTLGSVFWLEALVCFSRLQLEVEEKSHIWMADVLQQTITDVLEGLFERDYVLKMPDSSIPGATEYVFKHNMERELIQQMVNPERMRRYHLFAAQWLETKVPDRSEAQLEYLGQHYERGGNRRRAAFCFVRAGDKARGRYANEQAATFYRDGLRLLDLDDALSKIETLHNLGDVLVVLGRHQEALEQFSEMLRLAWLLDHRAKGGAAHRRIGRIHYTLGDHERAQNHLTIALRLFERAGDSRGAAATLDDVGIIERLRGEYDRALDFHRQALSIKREIGDPRSIAVSLNNIGTVHQHSGSFKAALECYVEALETRREVGDKIGVVDSLRNLGSAYRAQSSYTKAFELWVDGLRLAREIGDRLDEAYLLIELGEAKIQLGKLKEAAEHLEESCALAAELGDPKLKGDCARTSSEVQLALGDLAGAEQQALNALQIARELGLKPELAAAHRTLAEAVAAREITDENKARADELFQVAIKLLVEMGNDLQLARTFASFADFHDRCGQWEEADHFRTRADEIFSRLKEAQPPAR